MTLIKDIRSIYHRSQATIVQDFVGAAALGVILFGALHLPGL